MVVPKENGLPHQSADRFAMTAINYTRRICKMAFTAQDVKTLREMTNVGMMDCKKALI